jgi:hypothetical protein
MHVGNVCWRTCVLLKFNAMVQVRCAAKAWLRTCASRGVSCVENCVQWTRRVAIVIYTASATMPAHIAIWHSPDKS